jgi:glycosyltransferase involved in cell wall biosynthesis
MVRPAEMKHVRTEHSTETATKTVGLCMIVKDESKVILRCLECVRPIVDYVLIEDTGSTDGTQDIIREWLDRVGLPGEVYDEPWRDFAYNRSHALARLRKKKSIDYALILDADDQIVFEPDFDVAAFKNSLSQDLLDVERRCGPRRHRHNRICSNRRAFRYRGVLHEFIDTADGALSCGAGKVNIGTTCGFYISTTRESARSQDPNKYCKEAVLLEKALQIEREPFLRSRYTFYLAQSYRDASEKDKALECFLKRAELGYSTEEVFVSLYSAAQLQQEMGKPFEEVIATYLRASDAAPGRAEALHAASRLCRENNKFVEGYEYARRGLAIPLPSGGFFVEAWRYDYGLLDEFAVNAYWTGRYQECLEACQRLLRERKMPEDNCDRVKKNADFAADKIRLRDFPHARICLNMIVRNEVANLERCLRSVADHIACWVIGDTGSTDGTQELIERFFAARGIPGELHSFPFENFAQARNEALDHAHASALPFEYILLTDADMQLTVQNPAFSQGLTAAAYMVLQRSGVTYWNTRLLRRDVPALYRGVTHEYLDLGTAETKNLEGVGFIDHASGSNRGDKYPRDIQLLTDALAMERDPGLKARYTFYLANTLRDGGDKEAALRSYLERARLGYWYQEVFMSLLNAARLKEELKYSNDEVVAAYVEAAASCPTRAEALHGAARFCGEKGLYERGYQFAKQGLAIPHNLNDALFVQEWIYEYGLLDELAINAYWTARYAECVDACDRLLSEGKLPAEMRDRVLKNKGFAIRKQQEIAASSSPEAGAFLKLLGAARQKERLAGPNNEVIAAYMEATAACPTRAEALHGAARFCGYKGLYERGYEFAAKGLAIACPKDALEVEDWIYEYGLLDELAVNAYWTGRYAECVDACDRLLGEGKLPTDERDRVRKNRKFAVDKLEQVRRCVHSHENIAIVEGDAVLPQEATTPKPRIWLYMPYFGAFPNYFQLYLDSLGRNADCLSVFLMTDNDLSGYRVPDNLVPIQLTLGALREKAARLINDEFGMNVLPDALLKQPYKLADFRIMYLELFRDVSERYGVTNNDFVGWGDCDLIYGRFLDFLDMKDEYQIIGGFHGHFTAFRNIDSFRRLFKAVEGLPGLLLDETPRIVDEVALRKPLKDFLEGNEHRMFYINRYFCDIVPECFLGLFRRDHAQRNKNFFDVYHSDKEIDCVHYDRDGRLTVVYEDGDSRQSIYCHLQKRAMSVDFDRYENGYYIREHAFCLAP